MKLYNAGHITMFQPKKERYQKAREMYLLLFVTAAIVTALYFIAT